MSSDFRRASDDLDDFPYWLLPKKSQKTKGEEAVTARYERRSNMCPVHMVARRLIDGECDYCE